MSELVLNHPAHVRQLPVGSSEPLQAILREIIGDDARLAYFWRAEISNDLLDSHFTYMRASTLKNYAEDAARGVAFLRGHDWSSLPLGYSLTGQMEEHEGRTRTLADFYTLPGLAETDDLIARIKSQMLRDVSIGFHGGEMVCRLCTKDFWSCPHLPGFRYEGKVATFDIEDARLSEVSGVFDGSTPNAMILKARQMSDAGDLTQEQAYWLERNFRVRLPAGKRSYPAAGSPLGAAAAERESRMTPEEVRRIEEVVARFEGVVFNAEDLPATFEAMGAQHQAALQSREALGAEAADGRKYRSDLVAEALAEGVRAYGNAFDKATYEAMLGSAPIDTIKRIRDDFKATADKDLPAGRATQNEGDAPAAPRGRAPRPARAYAS